MIYAYHSVMDYVTALDSQEELRRVMDLACDDAMSARLAGSPAEIKDVFSGSFVRSFKGLDSKLFIDRPEGEGRLLFSLNLDFFNPEGNRERGAHTSTGILAMACLNIPPEIRYKAQNMYIAGIIPGPVEPKLTEGNHFLRLLIDDLEIGWKHRILFTHVTARLVRFAVACVVCDIPRGQENLLFGGCAE